MTDVFNRLLGKELRVYADVGIRDIPEASPGSHDSHYLLITPRKLR